MRYLPDISNDTGAAQYRRESVPQFRFVAGSPQETPMITQPTPHLEARPAAPDVQHRLPIRLPGRPQLRPAPQGIRAIDTHIPNIALAGLQLLLGYEWLLAGGDKLLLGRFPAQLGGMLLTLVGGGHLVGRDPGRPGAHDRRSGGAASPAGRALPQGHERHSVHVRRPAPRENGTF